MCNQDSIVPLGIEGPPCLVCQCDWTELTSILQGKRIECIGCCIGRNSWEGRRCLSDGLFLLCHHRTLLPGRLHYAPDLLNCFMLIICDDCKVQKNPHPSRGEG